MTRRSSQPSTKAAVFRPAAERFLSTLDWLESWHSFSFAHHYDPAWLGFGPLRVINDDTIAAGRGFGLHPHRDMEIITVMLEGELSHSDSMGNGEMLRAGEVQRMSAGSGVVHSEINRGAVPCRLLQIWIEPSSHGSAPAYEQKPFALGDDWTLLLDPEGRQGAMALNRPVRLWRARPAAGSRLGLPLAAGRQSWLQLIDGSVRLDSGRALERGDGLGFVAGPEALISEAEGLTAEAAGADLLLFELA
ncbi:MULTISPECIES: pirin-like bicupin family protein [Synechococcaceae]|uniref:pirin family protein n=1 Tax=Synechococcaceae TaxID=1890426 RepID=UPI0008FF731C|nr:MULTISPECIES: pirin-like bicupin family protein [Synechococcaceae]APD47700.1 hypothetical protein BM449_04735 [Synechococcus sp. SynAce01]MCT4365978.1 pirin family protein [Candidatus Regnicoccus frigidus MAG-AL1]MCT4366045.1 pirin family protein [Candidatus Regnicoccus frigidus MAG-AL2]TWB89280.1 hypothetical protein FB106_11375 [Synechococcus sp. Ace-Pa]